MNKLRDIAKGYAETASQASVTDCLTPKQTTMLERLEEERDYIISSLEAIQKRIFFLKCNPTYAAQHEKFSEL